MKLGVCTAFIGLGASAVCLAIFGADSFLIPAMLVILFLLTAMHAPIERSVDA